jgi:hypothetical protein
MKKMIKFPSIDQFRTVVSNINRQYNFVGLDENGEAIYDPSLPKPTLKFKGTVKLHGTNAGVSYNEESGMWAQSRENIITPEHDNAGFAFFAHSHETEFLRLFIDVANKEDIDMHKNTISIYGEWVGKGIQKGVGISNIEKSFFIFGVKITPHTGTEEELKANPSYWVESSYLQNTDVRIYNIEDFQTYEIEIDFNMPQLVQNKLSDLTIAVEEQCPVAKHFGLEGIGEGIVWSIDFNGVVHRFKVKGEKHSSSKVKTLAAVDVEKLNSINEFVQYVVTESRFNQAVENTFPNNEPIDIKKMGDLIRWVVNDVIKEEMDTLVKNGLEPKDVNKYVSSKVREMFFKLGV